MNFTHNTVSSQKRRHAYAKALTAMMLSLLTIIASVCLPAPLMNVAFAESNQPVMIQAGHADFGPTLIDNKWKMKIRDDTGDEPVWRDPENVVFRLANNAIVPMPNDAAYSFIGEKPGTKLYVIPQTQNPDVPWLGWNTQEGGVLNELDRGANLSLDGVSGPGKLHVYLENGNNNPQQLWDSTKGYPQNTWIETNAHTHVNWVFSKPGVYHVKLTFSGKLKNGRTVSDTRVLNFAVGDSTDPQAALGAATDGGDQSDEGNADDNDADNAGADGTEENTDGGDRAHAASRNVHKQAARNADTTSGLLQLVGIMVAIVAIIIVAFVGFAVVKSRKARQQALAEQHNGQQSVQPMQSVQTVRAAQQTQPVQMVQTINEDNNLSNLVSGQETTVMAPIDTHTTESGASQFDSSGFDSSGFDSSQWK